MRRRLSRLVGRRDWTSPCSPSLFGRKNLPASVEKCSLLKAINLPVPKGQEPGFSVSPTAGNRSKPAVSAQPGAPERR
jgi:hypothetical protein